MASEAAVQPTTKRAAHPYHMYDAIVEQPERVAQVLATQRELIESAADAAARKRLVLVGIGTRRLRAAASAELSISSRCVANTRSEEHTSELQSLAYLVC